MTATSESGNTTEVVARCWFEALAGGDVEGALALLADDIEFINYLPVPGYNTDMQWIGTWRGPDKVRESFSLFVEVVDVRIEELLQLIVEGEHAAGVIHEISTVKSTGMDFEIEFVQWLTVRNGKIVRWISYTDPSQIIRALRGDH